MSLLSANRQNLYSTDVASVQALRVNTVDADVLSCTNVAVTNLNAQIINEATVSTTTGLNTDTLNSSVLSCTALAATNADFSNPPTCTQVASAADQLVNKLYVDNAVPAGGGTVEEVTGTNPISATVNTTLLSGTSHTLPSGTTIGTIKTIVNTNDSAFTRVIDVGSNVLPSRTAITTMAYDAVRKRVYVGGEFPNINSVAGTQNLAYYDLQLQQWFPLGTPVFTTGSAVQDILIKGSRLYIIGSFTSVLATTGNDNTRHVAYCNLNDNSWNPLVPVAVGTGFVTCSTSNNQGNFLRAFDSRPNTVFIVKPTGYTFTPENVNNQNPRFKVVMFDESVVGTNPFQRLYPTAGGGFYSNEVLDLMVQNDYLYLIGSGRPQDLNPAIPSSVSDFGITTYSFTTQQFVNGSIGQNLVGAAHSILPYNWNGTDGFLVLGIFTAFASNPLVNIAFIPSLLDPATITLQQFPPAFSPILEPSNNVLSSSNPITKLTKDSQNTLYITSFNFFMINSSPIEADAVHTTVLGSNARAIVSFDSALQRWRVLTTTFQPLCMTITDDPDKLWFGGEISSSPPTRVGTAAGGVLFTTNMLIQLDKSKLQDVVGTFVSNTRPRNKFMFVYKGQTLTFINVDNTRWVLVRASSNLVNAGFQNQQQSGAVFFV